jgi:hypothetical protein
VRFGEVLRRVKGERNILQTIKRRKDDWTGYMWHGSCLLIEGGMDVRGRRGRRGEQLLDDLQERRGYWKLGEEALVCSV